LAISSEFVGRRFIGGFGDLTNSSDVMWGCKLVALRAEPLAITNDLPSRVEASVGNSLLLLEVGLRGGPASYRWYKNGSVIIDLAFSEPLNFPLQNGDANVFWVYAGSDFTRPVKVTNLANNQDAPARSSCLQHEGGLLQEFFA
jgi:hypothetical protein